MKSSGIKSSMDPLETSGATARHYVKLANFHIKAGRLEAGLYYLEVSLSLNPDLTLALTSLAKCHLLMGHWLDAMKVHSRRFYKQHRYKQQLVFCSKSKGQH